MITKNKAAATIPPQQLQITHFVWEQANTPRMNILRQLVNQLLNEVEKLPVPEPFDFDQGFNLSLHMQKFEQDLIRHALQLTNYNQRAAAQLLGIKSTTLNAKIKRLQIACKSPTQGKK